MSRYDVLVLGAGPAGTFLAAELAARGLLVGLLAPEHPAPWPNTYGAWEDDLPQEVRTQAVAGRWECPAVRAGGPLRTLERAYVRLDNARLQQWALARAPLALVTGEAAGVHEDGRDTVVRDAFGAAHRAGVVVDTSGHRSPLARWRRGPAPGVQTAWGVLAEVRGEPLEGHPCVLMDYDDAHVEDAARDRVPSFLYGMRLPDGRCFLEETVLVARPAVPLALLKGRLRRRLAARGVQLQHVHEVERCWIPMGGPLPRRDGLAVGFGGAARMEHPATGYMLAHLLRAAPRLAQALAGALEAGPAAARRAGWEAVWPRPARRARALWTFGMEALLRFDADGTRRFFEAFFQLPGPDWRGYMSGTLDARALSKVMWRLFHSAPADVRMRLVAAGVRAEGFRLASALLTG